MLGFRQEMMQLSLKYPFIKKVVIDNETFGEMCDSFDKTLGQEIGTVREHVKEKGGSFLFESLYVEPEDKDA
jgi:hypothetical protein